MSTTIRHAHPSDYGRVIQHVNAWWGGRDMAPMLPKLFFLHFEGTSFVAENDDGTLAAFLIGFLSQTDDEEAYIHFVGVAPDHRAPGSDGSSTSASSQSPLRRDGPASGASPPPSTKGRSHSTSHSGSRSRA